MQEQVKKAMETYSLTGGIEVRYLDLMSELGELGKEILKGTNYGKEAYSPHEKSREEMGDCLFSLLALCCEMKIDAREALDCALRKYRERYDRNGSIGSGDC